MPTPKKTAARIGLYVTEKRDGEFYHVTAYPVTIGPTAYDLRTMDRTGEPHNVPWNQIRNFRSWDHEPPLYFANLHIVSQGDTRSSDRRLYGFGVEYRECYSIDARDAARMHQTLTTIARRMEKTAQTFGQPATFGAYMARVAEAISADALVFPASPSRPSYDDSTHRIDAIAEGIYRIDRMIETWIQAGQPKELAS